MDHPQGIDSESLILIVVGAHLRAELEDRPMAQRLREHIARHLLNRAADSARPPLLPVICTDVWYLNNAELMARPAVAVGEPGVNAAAAYLSNRLPTAMIVDGTLRIHLDPEFLDPQACLWGATGAATASATDLFIERYLADFVEAAIDA